MASGWTSMDFVNDVAREIINRTQRKFHTDVDMPIEQILKETADGILKSTDEISKIIYKDTTTSEEMFPHVRRIIRGCFRAADALGYKLGDDLDKSDEERVAKYREVLEFKSESKVTLKEVFLRSGRIIAGFADKSDDVKLEDVKWANTVAFETALHIVIDIEPDADDLKTILDI